jgi:hypothetical protein
MPPVFLQDLTNGTFSNSEQQDLFFVKHLVGQWAQHLKRNEPQAVRPAQRRRYVEHNLDGLLRGDFKTRAWMRLRARPVRGLYAERGANTWARRLSDDPLMDKHYIQGATVPLREQAGGTAAKRMGRSRELATTSPGP